MNILSLASPPRKAILAACGLLACIYAFSVIVCVLLTPDPGFRCAFTPTIVSAVERSPVGEGPAKGDTLTQVGRFPIETKPQLWAQVLLVRALQREHGPAYVHTTSGGVRQIHVSYRRHADSQVRQAWCRLGSPSAGTLVPSLLWLCLKLGLFVVGAVVFWKRPDDPSAAQFFLLCIVTVAAYMGGYHWVAISVHPLLLLVFITCAVLLPAVSLHFYLLFPRPKAILERRPRLTRLILYGVPLAFLTAILVGYFRVRAESPATPGPPSPALAAAWESLRFSIALYLGVAAVWYLASVVCLVHSYCTAARPTERNQVKWILFGALVALVPIAYSLYLVLWERDDFGSGAATWPMFLASVCFTAAFAISITRYRLMQLDQILTSGMVYFLMSSLAGLLFYGLLVGMLMSGVIAGPPSLPSALVASTTVLVLLVVLDLARGRLKKTLDRRFHREKHQLDRTLRRMGQAIEQLLDPATVARRLLQASAELMGVTRGAIYLPEGNPPLYRLAGSLGPAPAMVELPSGCPLVDDVQTRDHVAISPVGPLSMASRQLLHLGGAVAQAIAHENRLLALLVLGPREAGPYGTEDLNLLAAFAQVTALALENADGRRTIEALNRDLRAKVEKISEQQRRILALQSQLTRRDAPATEPAAEAPRPCELLGSSAAIRRLLDLVRKVSATQSAVLIRGESGTGKGLLARVLHEHGPRAARPFVKVHCAALSPGLLESELFGHVKGAFTSAHRDKVGRFELADGGVLFLDEIGDISLEVQTKLLRVLEEKTFERVGSSEPVRVDVQVIAATHQNLEELIARGRFREDLYYRLKVIDITVPPLRERREDIPELACHFMRLYASRCGRSDLQLDDDTLAALKAYPWMGNVRELENVVERAVVVSEGPRITPDDLPREVTHRHASGLWSFPEGHAKVPLLARGGIQAERAERGRREQEQLVRALAAARGNKAEAARALGLARSTLLSRLKKYGLS